MTIFPNESHESSLLNDEEKDIIDLASEQRNKAAAGYLTRILQNILEPNDTPNKLRTNYYHSIRRNLADDDESVDYWRKRAGWFDDDASMSNYNAGVYDTYYSVDDDGAGSKGSGGRSWASSRSSSRDGPWYSVLNANFWANMITIVIGLISIIVFILLARAIRRRISPTDASISTRKSALRSRDGSELRSRRRSTSRSRSKSRARSKSKERSRSRTRSRSRARRSNSDAEDNNYKLMEDEDPRRDRSSRRTRSRSRSKKRVDEMLV